MAGLSNSDSSKLWFLAKLITDKQLLPAIWWLSSLILTTTGKLKRLTKRTTLTLSCSSRAVPARPDTTYIPSKQMLMSVRSIVTITRGYDDYVYLIPILPVIPGDAGNRAKVQWDEESSNDGTRPDPSGCLRPSWHPWRASPARNRIVTIVRCHLVSFGVILTHNLIPHIK